VTGRPGPAACRRSRSSAGPSGGPASGPRPAARRPGPNS
jgi:hypothetical protein